MITITREKLNEAKYFLECMKEKQSDRDPFIYNLSAFLSAARSVTLFMQKEFKHVSGFDNWYASKQASMKSDKNMELLNEKRTITVHEQPVRPRTHIYKSLSEQLYISESILAIITNANGTVKKIKGKPTPTPPATTKKNEKTKWQWYFDEIPEKDVIAICVEHITKLENLVAECEKKFST